MAVDQRGQGAIVGGRQVVAPLWLPQQVLEQQGVDVDQTQYNLLVWN